MEQTTAAPDISEAVNDIVVKLNEKQKTVVKIPTNFAIQSFLLSQIIKHANAPQAPILLLAKDAFAKLNLIKTLEQLGVQAKTEVASDTIWEIQQKHPCLIIITEEESQNPLPSKKDFESHTIRVSQGSREKKEELLRKIITAGYDIARTAAEKGLAASRGSIIDIFPPNKKYAIRIDFEGEAIDKITHFSPKNGRQITAIKKETIIPNNLNHLATTHTVFDYNNDIKHIVFEPFPSFYDAQISIPQNKIQQLTRLVSSQDNKKEKHKIPSFVKNISKGDFVVHVDHGIAKFEGMVEQKIDSVKREYFKLCYAEGDVLFLPVTSAEKMEKYIGDPNPTLNRLSANGWGKTISKVGIDTLKHARELLNTQALRQLSRATQIPRSKKTEKDLEKTFPYKETSDQKQVIETIYEDLAKNDPMDRLVCGDVGFGKTEIAIRAAAKAALEGFQVAVLAPTTILSQQHIDTFTERLKKTPISIRALSRFQSKKTQQETIENIKTGKTDIVIGTHRLFSQEISFKNLGLIIIDEEQKFGVNHKEKLKKIRSQAHVLTLTATPIPRTLHLAISGVRPISTITTAPGGRKPIKTIIEPYNQKHVARAIQNEIKRGGQAYYLYNKVETMKLKTQELKEFMPKIKIGMLHGQMPEEQMAKVMHDFDRKKIDVLVCSTIIENGLDLPNVNTLIVDNAVRFGLAQLYQIRGRIGRGCRQAYSYFFFKKQKLTGEAQKRLHALEAARQLGSGFDLAQADMEIRGVGNVLGKAQHGHIKSIGLGLYLRLLSNAVDEIKSGSPSLMLSDISVDLPIETRIPKNFEPDKQKRIELYHKWALIDNLSELSETKEKLEKDGALPKVIENLFYVLRLKILGRKGGISAIDTAFASQSSAEQIIILQTENPLDPKTFARLLEVCDKWQYSEEEIKILRNDLGSDWMKRLEQCLKKISE